MDIKKKKAFNEKMSLKKRFPNHLVLERGGMVKRKNFDDGGIASSTTTGNVAGGTTQSPSLGGTLASAGVGAATGAIAGSTVLPGLGTVAGGVIGGLTGAESGLSALLTPQNQYQAQLAPTTQLDYAPTINAGANAALNPNAVNSAIAAEQGLAGQYQGIANGQGPNPAAAALQQETAQNVANTAALQAGQRGSSANAGLMARQIGQTGAATQQAGVQQAATLQAGQELNALGAQGGLQNQIATQGLGEQGVGANVLGTTTGALNSQNANLVSNYGQAQGLNQATAQSNAAATQKTSGGLLGGIGGVLSSLHEGGEVKKFDQGSPGTVYPSLGVDTSLTPASKAPDPNAIAAQSIVGKILSHAEGGQGGGGDSDPTGLKSVGSGLGNIIGDSGEDAAAGAESLFAGGGKVCQGPHKSHVANFMFAQGGESGKVPALVSAKEVYLNPHQVKEVVERGADPMKIGYRFPGKDRVKHNSVKNDKIPVTLQDGGAVVPIDITTHKEASKKSRDFVMKAHAKRYMKKPKGAKANA